jgi:hypothetical protein
VLLSDSPLKVDPIKIRDLQVLETIVGGEAVFKADGTWVPGNKILQ